MATGAAMTESDSGACFDEAAGRLVRPYAVTGGRTQPDTEFGLVTIVVSTGRPLGDIGPEHDQILDVCQRPVSVAEVSALVHLPVAVIKILLADLLSWQAIVTRAPVSLLETTRPERHVLEALLDGLRHL
jgi:hypothetical protein